MYTSKLGQAGSFYPVEGVYFYSSIGRKNANDHLKDLSLFQNKFSNEIHSLYKHLHWAGLTIYLGLNRFTISTMTYQSC